MNKIRNDPMGVTMQVSADTVLRKEKLGRITWKNILLAGLTHYEKLLKKEQKK